MDFCCELSLNHLIDNLKKNQSQNSVFSPLSYNVILNMIARGASGETLEEILRFLQCRKIKRVDKNSMKMMCLASEDNDNNNGSGPVIQCLNGIWFDHRFEIKSSYKKSAPTIYNARVKRADFKKKADKVVKKANAWAKESSKGLVTEVLKHGDLGGVKIVLGNALYFKGFWEDGFKSRLDLHFYLMNGKHKEVTFMSGCKEYSGRSFDGFEVVSIPYKKGENGNMFSMYIFLPDDRFGLQSLLDEAGSDSGFLRQDFQLEHCCYDIFRIPKFKFSYYTCEGPETMQKMGLNSPFSDGLTEMVNGKIRISKIVQKSFIEIDDEGTKAAAVTWKVGLIAASRPSRRHELSKFIANHPFMFMLREEKSKFVLFTGVVLDPNCTD